MVVAAKMDKYPGAQIKVFDRPFMSVQGILASEDVVVAFFQLLGAKPRVHKVKEEDKGKLPLGVRDILEMLRDFLTEFVDFAPDEAPKVAEATMLGIARDWFRNGFDPARNGKSARAVVPTSFAQVGNAHVLALQAARTRLTNKSQRSREENASVVSSIPYLVETCGSASSTTRQREDEPQQDDEGARRNKKGKSNQVSLRSHL
jgi:hypothetical protein